VYSAWQIPKAKHLLHELSQLRPNDLFQTRAEQIVQRYGFVPERGEACGADECYFLRLGNQLHSERISEVSRWFLYHGGRWLGYRVWIMQILLNQARGRVSYVQIVFAVDDGSPMESGLTFHSGGAMPSINEALPDFSILNSRGANKILSVYTTPQTKADVFSAALDPDFSCIWGLRICDSSWQVLPKLKAQYDLQNELGRKYSPGSDLCPVRNMYARVRDAKYVSVGMVTRVVKRAHYDGARLSIHIDRTLRHQAGVDAISAEEQLSTLYLERQLFPQVPKVGDKFIFVGGSIDCHTLPRTKENLTAMEQAVHELSKFD
jgi:hypothetical protein